MLCRFAHLKTGEGKTSAMEARVRRVAPVPHRRLVLLLLAEGEQVSDWRSTILAPALPELLGATRTSSLVLLFLGLDETFQLQSAHRSVRAVLFATSASAADDARRLRRLYLA